MKVEDPNAVFIERIIHNQNSKTGKSQNIGKQSKHIPGQEHRQTNSGNRVKTRKQAINGTLRNAVLTHTRLRKE